MSEKERPVAFDLRSSVVRILNEACHPDQQGLSQSRILADELRGIIRSLGPKISPSEEGAPHLTSKSDEVLSSVKKVLARSEILFDNRSNVENDVKLHCELVKDSTDELQPFVRNIHLLENYQQYLEWLQEINNISLGIGEAFGSGYLHEAVAYYVMIADICERIECTACQNLKSFALSTRNVWHAKLKSILDKEFQEILKLLKWPFVNSTSGPNSVPTYDVLSRFETTFGYLLDIEPSMSSDEDNCLLPLRLLFQPFRWRFLYHFSGNKKTNCISKPEWYFTQVLNWIKSHVNFLDTFVQPFLNRAGRGNVIAKTKFINYLLALVNDKLSTDITKANSQEMIVRHIIDEALLFEKELRGHNYGYLPQYSSSVVSILMRDDCFSIWMKLEREVAMDNMDKLFVDDEMWQPLCLSENDTDTHDYKMPKFAENFVTMILCITDRYKYLSMPSHRLQFILVQLELIDDFRIRMLQLLREQINDPLCFKFITILNAVYYVANVLKDWSDLPFFVRMQFYLRKHKYLCEEYQRQNTPSEHNNVPQDDPDGNCLKGLISTSVLKKNHFLELNNLENELEKCYQEGIPGGVFDEIVDLFERVKDDMLINITDYIVLEIKAKSYNYKHVKWFSLHSFKEFVTPSLTPAACEMFQKLTLYLNTLQSLLSLPLFNSLWQSIANKLDEFFYEEVLLVNKFNEGASAQFHFDMKRNLFVIFNEYTRRPENYFRKIKDSCVILTLNVGSALLLRETLLAQHIERCDDIAEVREELGIYSLTKGDVLNILNLRTELNNIR